MYSTVTIICLSWMYYMDNWITQYVSHVYISL